jgi:ATP-dependent DNA helicase RecG
MSCMPSKTEITAVLRKLERQTAEELEGQRLEFKAWNARSVADTVKVVVDAVICLANGGGGTVVVGVKNDVVGRAASIIGVPASADINKLYAGIYDGTEPTVSVTLEEMQVAEGTGRLILVHVHEGRPPYMDTSGRGSIRMGDACQPLTPAIVQDMLARTGESDFTAGSVEGALADLVSAAAMERLRELARAERADPDLLRKEDEALLDALGLMRSGKLCRAGLLLVGKPEAIAAHFPGYVWTYLKMRSDTDYDDRADGRECLILAVDKIAGSIANPIQTVKQQLLHNEFRLYPTIALREGLMNAFGHCDYRIAAPIQVKQFPDRLEISNPGGFIGGVSPENILQHQSVTRNPTLIAALLPVRLVNRAKVGVRRIYKAMLAEGKEPPELFDQRSAVRLVLHAGTLSPAFCKFVEDAASRDVWFDVEHLLIVRSAFENGSIDLATAARITQQSEAKARETLKRLDKWAIVQPHGKTGQKWRLQPGVQYELSGGQGGAEEIDTAVRAVIGELQRRKAARKPGLSIAEIQSLTRLDRERVKYVTRKLRELKAAQSTGRGRAARWILAA